MKILILAKEFITVSQFRERTLSKKAENFVR